MSASEAGARTRATGRLPGWVISLLLASIALHGLENQINQEFYEMYKAGKETWFDKKGTRFKIPNIIRYAYDFVGAIRCRTV
ncbi:MAG: hypothetical protein V7K89_00135 [Nostoc sp.]